MNLKFNMKWIFIMKQLFSFLNLSQTQKHFVKWIFLPPWQFLIGDQSVTNLGAVLSRNRHRLDLVLKLCRCILQPWATVVEVSLFFALDLKIKERKETINSKVPLYRPPRVYTKEKQDVINTNHCLWKIIQVLNLLWWNFHKESLIIFKFSHIAINWKYQI